MKSILAFGDSNTWGLVPGSKTLERFSWYTRWTGILQEKCEGTRIIEEGLCGRTTVFEDELRPGRKGLSLLPIILETHRPIDAAVIMLGTNDCKSVYGASAYTIGKGMELCLNELMKYLPPEKILLVSPILLGDDVYLPQKDPEFSRNSVSVSHGLKDVYADIALHQGTAFLAASDFAEADNADSEHLNAVGHRCLADAIYGKLHEMKAA